ncbi:MAG: MerR family transcriptional regulator, partial [Hyphococcus sp.]
MRGLLRIGELARLAGVSVKALRFYDEQGLLRPDHVDPHTGYRYYAVHQIKTLAAITNLRMIDFSIAEIAATLVSGDTSPARIRDAIKTKRDQLKKEEAALAEKSRLAATLARTFDADETTALPGFKLKPVEPE